jgi:hypothetical protein
MPKQLNKSWATKTVGGSSKQQLQDRTRILDGYHTPKIAILELIKIEKFSKKIWEPANGYNRISRVLKKKGYSAYTSDIYRWHNSTQVKRAFERFKEPPSNKHDIITNPPFKHAQMFVEHAMKLLPKGRKLALLLRLQFLEGKKRKSMFEKYPPKIIYVFSYRLPRMHRFDFDKKKDRSSGSILAFAWFVWQKGYKGETVVKWL